MNTSGCKSKCYVSKLDINIASWRRRWIEEKQKNYQIMFTSTIRSILHKSRLHHHKLQCLQSFTFHKNSHHLKPHNDHKSKSNQFFILPPPILTHNHHHQHTSTTSAASTIPQHTCPYHPCRCQCSPEDMEACNTSKNNQTTKNNTITPTPSVQTETKSEMSHNEILSILFKHAWPSTPDLRKRSLLAIGLMITSKISVVTIPFWYKSIVDAMTMSDISANPLIVPIGLVAGYGISRSFASICREAQTAVFSHVTISGTRKMAQQLFGHLHALDLEFHIQRQTGLLSKAMDRGVRAITYICNTTLINVIPTAVEVALVCGILGFQFEDKSFLVCTTATVGLYVLWSVGVTQYRTKLRQRMNKLDNASSATVIDSLINYETVKYCNNEQLEMEKYGDIMTKYQNAAIKVQTSLSLLNAGQNIIFTSGKLPLSLLNASVFSL